jgi:hypothetical protein
VKEKRKRKYSMNIKSEDYGKANIIIKNKKDIP